MDFITQVKRPGEDSGITPTVPVPTPAADSSSSEEDTPGSFFCCFGGKKKKKSNGHEKKASKSTSTSPNGKPNAPLPLSGVSRETTGVNSPRTTGGAQNLVSPAGGMSILYKTLWSGLFHFCTRPRTRCTLHLCLLCNVLFVFCRYFLLLYRVLLTFVVGEILDCGQFVFAQYFTVTPSFALR